MKIGFTGIDIPEGKVKYKDAILNALASKDKPKKVSPFFPPSLRYKYLNYIFSFINISLQPWCRFCLFIEQ